MHRSFSQTCHPEQIWKLNLKRLFPAPLIMPKQHPRPISHVKTNKRLEKVQTCMDRLPKTDPVCMRVPLTPPTKTIGSRFGYNHFFPQSFSSIAYFQAPKPHGHKHLIHRWSGLIPSSPSSLGQQIWSQEYWWRDISSVPQDKASTSTGERDFGYRKNWSQVKFWISKQIPPPFSQSIFHFSVFLFVVCFP